MEKRERGCATATRPLTTLLLILLTAMTPSHTTDHPGKSPVIRPATQAGKFYDGNRDRLLHDIDSLLDRHETPAADGELAALIVPHAGYYFSGNVAASAYKAIAPAHHYKRIILIGPSHYEWLDGASVNTEADFYSTPLGQVRVDSEAARHIAASDSVFDYRPEAHDREHCLEVQLPFLQRRLKEVPPIVPIIVSTNDYAHLLRIATALKPYLNGDNLFVISGDFSHYPSYSDAYEVDGLTRRAVESGDVAQLLSTLERNAKSGKAGLVTSACGEQAIITLLLMLDKGYDIRHILYQNSGDIDNHDPSRVVGYHSFAIYRKNKGTSKTANTAAADSTTFTLTDAEKATLKEIAMGSLRHALSGAAPVSPKLTPALRRNCGAFVSLMKGGNLRGCIGHFGEDTPLYEMVHEMALAAAFEDPRFPELRKEELPDIEVEISVLTPMRRIHSLDELQLGRHGIYIRKGMRSGTFLPQVADQMGWTKEEFVGYCSQEKAHIGWNGWRDAELYVYEAIVF